LSYEDAIEADQRRMPMHGSSWFRQQTEPNAGDEIDSIAFIHEYVADCHGCVL
jgi:hypothetical protein